MFEPPDGVMFVQGDRRRPFRVSDLYVRDDRVTHAGALATEVHMQLFVTAWKATSQPVPDELACFDRRMERGDRAAGPRRSAIRSASPRRRPIGAAMTYSTSRV